jgi:hypothetical protein
MMQNDTATLENNAFLTKLKKNYEHLPNDLAISLLRIGLKKKLIFIQRPVCNYSW